jgi:hypothetical protein
MRVLPIPVSLLPPKRRRLQIRRSFGDTSFQRVSSFAEANSQNLEIWELRAAAALATNDDNGKEAAEKLTALNALASKDNTVRTVMAALVMNGWLTAPGPPEPGSKTLIRLERQ